MKRPMSPASASDDQVRALLETLRLPSAIRLRGKMVEIYDFPDGRLEVRWKGRSLPYSAFDKLQRVSHAALSRKAPGRDPGLDQGTARPAASL
jgi:hypothetical protein